MTAAELGTLPSGLIAVGGHALTHQPLTSMTPDRQDAEIAGSRETCVRITGGEVTGFAYPHGDADARVRERVAAAGYRWACSTHSATVPQRGFDLFDLPRLMASDQPGPALIERLRAAA
jgi:peptidoglycan/xylan/chitin deacetylase (PgdA/CDA1 family)